jgi:hypothetical protein
VPDSIILASSYLGNVLNEYSSSYSYGVLGLTAETNFSNQYQRLGAYNLNTNSNYYETTLANIFLDSEYASLSAGSYLVRDISAVPITTSIWLFCSGLIGLGCFL